MDFQLSTIRKSILDIQSMYSQDGGRKRKLYLIIYISFTQPLLMWLLTR